MSKIFWKAHEIDLLAAAAAPLVAEGWEPWKAVAHVQGKVLPHDRIRPLDSARDIFLMQGKLAEKVAAIQGTKQVAPRSEPNAAIPPWMEAQIEQEAQREAERLRKLYEEEVAKRIRAKLASAPVTIDTPPPAAAPATAPVSAPPVQRKHNPEPTTEQRANLPKVVLVGYWPRIREAANRECAGVLDLRFFDNNRHDMVVMARHANSAALVLTEPSVANDIVKLLKQSSRHWESLHGSEKQVLDRLTRFAVNGK